MMQDAASKTTATTTGTSTATSSAPAALSLSGLETVYDAMATAINQAGPQRSELFLVKLALLNAQALGDTTRFQQHLQRALEDL